MARPYLLVFIAVALLFTATAWAGDGVASQANSAVAAPDQVTVVRVRKRLERSGAEVRQLQRTVHEQESKSHAADRRLHEQDQKLEQLRHQLDALGASSSASAGAD